MSKTYKHDTLRIHTDSGEQGDLTGYTHKGCGGEIVYNGNYFCEHWRTCNGISSTDEYDERTQRWGPPALERQTRRFVAGLAANRRGEFQRHGEVEIL